MYDTFGIEVYDDFLFFFFFFCFVFFFAIAIKDQLVVSSLQTG